jgi:DNA-binding beta-propeller fold protein YncE
MVPVAHSTIAVGSTPADVSISPNGLFALVANFDPGTITPLDLSNPLAPIAKTPVAVRSGPTTVVISPDGLFAIVTNFNDNSVTPLDLANPLVPVAQSRLAVGSEPVCCAISSNGLATFCIVVLYGASTAIVLDLANPLIPVVRGGLVGTSLFYPSGIAISPDGRFGFIINSGLNNIMSFKLPDPFSNFSITSAVGVGTGPDGRNVRMIYSR